MSSDVVGSTEVDDSSEESLEVPSISRDEFLPRSPEHRFSDRREAAPEPEPADTAGDPGDDDDADESDDADDTTGQMGSSRDSVWRDKPYSRVQLVRCPGTWRLGAKQCVSFRLPKEQDDYNKWHTDNTLPDGAPAVTLEGEASHWVDADLITLVYYRKVEYKKP